MVPPTRRLTRSSSMGSARSGRAERWNTLASSPSPATVGLKISLYGPTSTTDDMPAQFSSVLTELLANSLSRERKSTGSRYQLTLAVSADSARFTVLGNGPMQEAVLEITGMQLLELRKV